MSHQEIHKASPYPMLPVPEALALTLAHTRVMTAHDVDLSRALGLVLAHDVHAADPLPPFPASIKDGYAVVAEVFFSCIYIYIYISPLQLSFSSDPTTDTLGRMDWANFLFWALSLQVKCLRSRSRQVTWPK